MERKFSPCQVFDVLGLEAVQIRDWRRRGFLRDVGEVVQRGEREQWRYAPDDLLLMSAVKALSGEGLLISMAFDIAYAVRPFLRTHLEMANKSSDLILCFPDHDGNVVASRLDSLSGTATLTALIIDLRILADRVPEELHACFG